MNSLPRKIVLITSLAISLCLVGVIHAQTIPTIGNVSPDGIDIGANPANPAPGANVIVNVVSFSTDLDRASISWLVGGKALTKGTGNKSINVTAPAPGKSLQVMAVVNTVEGASITKVISIKSGSVDLLWETTGYVPPFYRGKIPFVYQNTINLIAMPYLIDKNGAAIDPKNLVYRWQQDDQTLGGSSGYGKQTLQITGPLIGRPSDITVTVSSLDQNTQGQASMTLTPVVPSIVLYEKDPLYGTLYNRAIGDVFRLMHDEVTITAAPFGFNIPQSESAFVYNWNVNNIPQDSLTTSRDITLRTNPGQQGSSAITLSLTNTGNDILESADAAFTAVFNSTAKTNATTF